MRKNVASQVVGAQLNSKTDGSEVTTGTTTVYVTGDGGTQATGSVGSGACTHEGHGLWTYAPAQAETNYDHVVFTFANTSAVSASVQIYTAFPQTGDSFARIGAPAGASVSADVAAIQSDTNDIQTRLPAALVSGRMDSSVGAMAANVITTASIADGAITNAKVADDLTVGNVTGAVGSVTGSVGSIASGGITSSSFAAGAINAAAIATNAIDADALATDAVTEIQAGLATAANLAIVDTVVDAIKVTTDKLDTMVEADGGVYRYTTNALEQAPTGGSAPTAAAIADAVWDEAIADHAAAGSTGEALAAAQAGSDPAAIADAVWDEPIAGHLAAGSTGNSLNNATSAGNPWEAVLEGSLTAGDLQRITAGFTAGKTTITPTGTDLATIVFRDASDLSNIGTVNMDHSERIAITLSP